MANFPFFRSFYPNYYPYYRNYNFTPKQEVAENAAITVQANPSEETRSEKSKKEPKEQSFHSRSFGPIHFNFDNPFDIDKETPIIEILGIPLFLDDLIILGLLFFLYKENVKDDMLFISLIMLLLS